MIEFLIGLALGVAAKSKPKKMTPLQERDVTIGILILVVPFLLLVLASIVCEIFGVRL